MSDPIIKFIREPKMDGYQKVTILGRPDLGYVCIYACELEECKLLMQLMLQASEHIIEAPPEKKPSTIIKPEAI